MHVKQYCIVAIAALLAIAGCKMGKPAAGATAVTANDTLTDLGYRKIMRDKELYAATTELVPLDTAYLTKDTLHIFTKRILGCDEENFKLMWNGAMLKSLPPQTSVKLYQQVEPDCKERHTFHLTYNIKPLQLKRDSAMLVKDTAAIKTTLLRIGNYNHLIPYQY